MGIVSMFGKPKKSIDEYVAEAKREGYVLVDVRNPDEFAQGHISGAINVPTGMVKALADRIADKDDTLYLYCHSGMRSAIACRALKTAGTRYAGVANIGGIKDYHGRIERSDTL